jgi:hypothetical protein
MKRLYVYAAQQLVLSRGAQYPFARHKRQPASGLPGAVCRPEDGRPFLSFLKSGTKVMAALRGCFFSSCPGPTPIKTPRICSDARATPLCVGQAQQIQSGPWRKTP